MIDMNIKVVAEYPDQIEENQELLKQVDEMNLQINTLQEHELQLQTQNYQLSMIGDQKDQTIRQLQKENENQLKKIKQFIKQDKQSQELANVHEQQIESLEKELQKKNDELEERLETVSKLIQKNEQLAQQLRVQKGRLEKFKTEQINLFQKDISDKSSEIEVLKEMVKSNQL